MTGPEVDARERNAMSFGELVAWAWRETSPVHKSTGNLLLHIVAVPMFVAGHALMIAAIAGSRWFVVAGASCVVVSVALQRLGHSMEPQAVHPFAGPRDLVRRIYAEQFWDFWRFLCSGGWLASLKASLRGAEQGNR